MIIFIQRIKCMHTKVTLGFGKDGALKDQCILIIICFLILHETQNLLQAFYTVSSPCGWQVWLQSTWRKKTSGMLKATSLGFPLFPFLNFYWSIVDSQCCVSCRCKVNQLYTYIYPLFFIFFSHIVGPLFLHFSFPNHQLCFFSTRQKCHPN